MKHRIVHILQKYVFNPLIKLMFAMGVALPFLTSIKPHEGEPRIEGHASTSARWRAGKSGGSGSKSLLPHFFFRAEPVV